MSKYIIDVGDAYIRHGLERTLIIPVRINEHEDHWMDTRIPVTPYTEPDLEQVREEAYADGYKEGCDAKFRRLTGSEYQRGLNDAWECARKIVLPGDVSGIYLADLEEIFDRSSLQDVIKDYSASECIEKIRQYEQEKEEQIQVGDEVKAFERKPFIVTGFGYGDEDTVYCHGFVTENGISTIAKKDECVKTGRHFPEIAEVLQKMKEES